MLSLAVATLYEMGVAESQRHIFLASQQNIATLVLSRSPFSLADLAALEKAANFLQHTILISPTINPRSEVLYKILTATDREELDRYTDTLAFDLSPPTDNRPFFFNQLRLNNLLDVINYAKEVISHNAAGGGIKYGNLMASATLLILFLVSFGLVSATIIFPLRHAIKDVGSKLATGGTLYFLLIGIGFMMVEIGLLQRMSMFLGHPIYSLSVLLFTLILATGIGSLASEKLKLDSQPKFTTWAILTSGYLIILPLWLPDVLLNFDSASLLVRSAICVTVIAPAGILMGYGFPVGMKMISTIDQNGSGELTVQQAYLLPLRQLPVVLH